MNNLPTLIKASTRAFMALLLVISFTGRLLAADLPAFSDPDVNAFVKLYAQFTDDYVAAYKAMQAGDYSKFQALSAKSGELQAKGSAMSSKLKPEESQRYSDFMLACSKKMSDAMSAAPAK